MPSNGDGPSPPVPERPQTAAVLSLFRATQARSPQEVSATSQLFAETVDIAIAETIKTVFILYKKTILLYSVIFCFNILVVKNVIHGLLYVCQIES